MLAAAGLGSDVPHTVTHALATRLKRISDRVVEDYTSRNLPLLESELRPGTTRERGDDPEFDGLPLDPEPEPGVPFLFTFAQFEVPDAPPPERPPLSDAAKQALRAELRLADECGRHVTGLMVMALREQVAPIHAAIERFVEPQIDALLAELAQELDAPPGAW